MKEPQLFSNDSGINSLLSQWIQLKDKSKARRAILNQWLTDLWNLASRYLIKITPFSLRYERFTPHPNEQYRGLTGILDCFFQTQNLGRFLLFQDSKAILNNIKQGSPLGIQGIHIKWFRARNWFIVKKKTTKDIFRNYPLCVFNKLKENRLFEM